MVTPTWMHAPAGKPAGSHQTRPNGSLKVIGVSRQRLRGRGVHADIGHIPRRSRSAEAHKLPTVWTVPLSAERPVTSTAFALICRRPYDIPKQAARGGGLAETTTSTNQPPAYRNMESRSGSRPIVGSGAGVVSRVAIMSSSGVRSGSFRKRSDGLRFSGPSGGLVTAANRTVAESTMSRCQIAEPSERGLPVEGNGMG